MKTQGQLSETPNSSVTPLKWCLLPALFLFVAPAFASETKLSKETYLEMESISNPAISPDGKQILFSRGGVDKKRDRQMSHLWLVDVESGRLRELTVGSFQVSSPVWSPDGKQIAFLSDRDGSNQIHVMWLETREVAQLTHEEHSPTGLKWSPDATRLAFTMFLPDTNPILPIQLPSFPRGAELAKPAIIVDRLSWRRDGRGYLPKGYTHVFVIDAQLGGSPKQITSGDYNHSNPEWSLDGETIFVGGIRKPDAEYQRNDSEIYAVAVDSGDIRTLTSRRGPDTNPAISTDGRWIAYTGYDQKDLRRQLSSLYLMDVNGGSQRMLAGDLPNSPSNLIWAPDGSGIYFVMQSRGHSNLYFAPTGGALQTVTQGKHVLSSISIAKTGRVAGVRSSFQNPGDLVSFSIGQPGQIRSLVDVNHDVLDGLQLGESEELLFKAPDGVDLQGWLMKPAEFEAGKKYPLLLWIHGGPYSMYSVRWNWAWQNFAATGYAVLWMNPRGSTGYGQKFVDGIQNGYPGDDFQDLMAAVDAAIAKGFVDEQNLFVTGGSGGGILTAWIVGHTDRFRAAVSMRPVINWHSLVGNTDGHGTYNWYNSYPWKDPMEYARESPLTYVGNVTTPTMLLCGEADLRTPISQSEEFYRALKIQKKETLLVRIPGEYHGFRRPSNRLRQQLYLRAWFEKYRVNRPSEITSGSSQ